MTHRQGVTTASERIDGPAISTLLAHQFPFLLVDGIEILQPGHRVRGFKQITIGEWWAERWVHDRDVRFPFSLVIEAMAQTSAGLMRDLPGVATGAIAYFMGVTHVRRVASAELTTIIRGAP